MIVVYVAQFFAWIGMFTLWLFALPLIASLPGMGALPDAIRWLGFCLAAYVLVAAVLGFAIHIVVRRIGAVTTHGLALLFGSCGLVALAFASSAIGAFSSFLLVSIGWASLSTIPYQIASERVADGRYARAMGIFNFSTVVPQVAIALSLGLLTEHLSPSMALLAGGGAMALGGIIMVGYALATTSRASLPNAGIGW